MKKYKYFVSYYFTSNKKKNGMGNIGVDSSKEIKDIDDLEEVKKHIEKNTEKHFGIQANIIILNFQLLNIEEN